LGTDFYFEIRTIRNSMVFCRVIKYSSGYSLLKESRSRQPASGNWPNRKPAHSVIRPLRFEVSYPGKKANRFSLRGSTPSLNSASGCHPASGTRHPETETFSVHKPLKYLSLSTMEHTETPRTVHQGRNVKRFREMLGIKQEALADQLGGDWSQKKISLVESKETIEPGLLDELAKALKVPSEAIKNFSEEAAYNIIGNTVTNNDNVAFFQYNPTFNPVEKWLQALEENKRLYEELLKSEREKVAMLERMLHPK
jgi:transcriptional regulator with XRE-family HTH domain